MHARRSVSFLQKIKQTRTLREVNSQGRDLGTIKHLQAAGDTLCSSTRGEDDAHVSRKRLQKTALRPQRPSRMGSGTGGGGLCPRQTHEHFPGNNRSWVIRAGLTFLRVLGLVSLAHGVLQAEASHPALQTRALARPRRANTSVQQGVTVISVQSILKFILYSAT